MDKPESRFSVGDSVMIKVGSQSGQVAEIDRLVWHFKEESYYYFLTLDNKNLSRRYAEGELEEYRKDID